MVTDVYDHLSTHQEQEEKIKIWTATNDIVIIVINLRVPAILNLRQEKEKKWKENGEGGKFQ